MEKSEEFNRIMNELKLWFQAQVYSLVDEEKVEIRESRYRYKLDKFKDKLLLTVKIMKKQQLVIPIYYNSFQNIIPELLNTIQRFEKIANECKIEFLICDIDKK